ncbi:MAG: hypothetical protein HY763_09290 [Planctomycetes bacterium]|nr:hypothetical protein [Planctomycetota bacterium]
MDLQTLADLAGQVIVGRVASVRAYESAGAAGTTEIESEVTLTEVEYLKGALPDSGPTFSLRVPGGAVGARKAQIGCTPRFAPGERWLLFLLPTYKTFPVVGLYQGAFRLEREADGVERVRNYRGAPLVGVGDGHMPMVAGGPEPRWSQPIGAEGVEVVPPPVAAAPAISWVDFRARLEPILRNSKTHRFRSPAGRREPVVLTPVPLPGVAPDPAGGRGDARESRPGTAPDVAPPGARPRPAARNGGEP